MPATNPILPGFNPDPSICRVGSDYFLATSTFEYFPGVPIYHSTDLVNWKLIGHALNRPSQLYMRTTVAGGGIFAPTLRHYKGRWYMTTCCVRERRMEGGLTGVHDEIRGFIVSTDDIWDETKWSDPLPIDMVGIDQDLFFDDDGKVYLCTSRLGGGPRQPKGALLTTYGAEIDVNTGRNLTRPVMLRDSDLINRIAEGPHIYKKDGYYYLMVAEAGTEEYHQEWIFRSKSPLGPYELPPKGVNPLVFNGPDGGSVWCTGHADMFEGTDGKWWVVMLGTRPQANGVAQLGRETFLAPVEWTEDGWPVFNGKEKIGLTVKGIDNGPGISGWSDDFSGDKLSPGWYSVRTPVRQEHSLNVKSGHLTLYGNPFRIDQLESPALLCRKQLYHRGTWLTTLDFEPETEYEEAGTAVFWSNFSFISVIVRKKGDGRELVLRWNTYEDEKRQEVVTPLTASGPIKLGFKAESTSYTPFYQESGSDSPKFLQQLESNVVCRNKSWDSPFTGTHFALFAQGADGESCLTPAHFGKTSFEMEQ